MVGPGGRPDAYVACRMRLVLLHEYRFEAISLLRKGAERKKFESRQPDETCIVEKPAAVLH
jgi:hypothetical protein